MYDSQKITHNNLKRLSLKYFQAYMFYRSYNCLLTFKLIFIGQGNLRRTYYKVVIVHFFFFLILPIHKYFIHSIVIY